MIQMLVSLLLCLATMIGMLMVLSLVVRAQIRRYNATVAAERLDRWEQHLARLEPAERERARSAPPAAVLDALLFLPSRGRSAFFTGWDATPMQGSGPAPEDDRGPTGAPPR
jgi:hypothetical protein